MLAMMMAGAEGVTVTKTKANSTFTSRKCIRPLQAAKTNWLRTDVDSFTAAVQQPSCPAAQLPKAGKPPHLSHHAFPKEIFN